MLIFQVNKRIDTEVRIVHGIGIHQLVSEIRSIRGNGTISPGSEQDVTGRARAARPLVQHLSERLNATIIYRNASDYLIADLLVKGSPGIVSGKSGVDNNPLLVIHSS